MNHDGSKLVNFGSIGYRIIYKNSEDWIDRSQLVKDPYPGYGAAWLEYDASDELILEMRFSQFFRPGFDRGIYRARYASLAH